MSVDRILSGLSLAQKAGRVSSGEFETQKAVREGSAHLVIVAKDASDNTKHKMQNMTDHYRVPLYFYSDKESLGRAIGREYRSMAAVCDEGFAASMERKLIEINRGGRNEYGKDKNI
ncbi:MAG: ribosomal L7Ae/L30e/S12e/Gadd45 family protein [Clostridiales bacterium]|nr:ribosomal L7Ae/L30e/S12e/Gadd45 family protein [Clostridiales bacterium]